MIQPFAVTWNAEGSATILGRLCAEDGTGADLGAEGLLLKAADVASLRVEVYDLTLPVTRSYTASLTTLEIAAALSATLQTSGVWLRIADGGGGNFRYVLPPSAFPSAGHLYQCEIKVTTTGGTVGWGFWKGAASVPRGS